MAPSSHRVSGPDHGTPIRRIRVDVSPGEAVDEADYIDEEYFDLIYADIEDAADFAGGAVSTSCSPSDERQCGVFWQGDGLFIAVVSSGDEALDVDQAITVAEALVPAVITRLAG